jgi:hypothetical protein
MPHPIGAASLFFGESGSKRQSDSMIRAPSALKYLPIRPVKSGATRNKTRIKFQTAEPKRFSSTPAYAAASRHINS